MSSRRRLALFILAVVAIAALGPFLRALPARAGAPGHAPAGAPAGALATEQGWTASSVHFQPLDPAGAPLAADGIGAFRGALTVAPDGGGLAVVNDVGLQDYLRGISEMPATWPSAALQAQVIAARTYAVWEELSGPSPSLEAAGAQVCATASCQVYRGLAGEQRPGAQAWDQAVATTAGQVLVYRGRVIFAAYGSSDGGQTASGGVPWLPSVADPEDAESPLHHWHWQAPLSTLAPLLGVQAPDHLVGLTSNGTGVVLTVAGTSGSISSVTMGAGTFFDTLNRGLPAPSGLPMALPSERFTVSTSGSQVVVDGGGWGNRLGLSQYGALGKALAGESAGQILGQYYGGAQVVRLPADEIPATIKVEVASGRPAVTVSSSSPFQVLDGSGKPLAVLGQGRWIVTPDGHGGVRIEPPSAATRPLAVVLESAEPGLLRFTVTVPAIVDVAVARAGGGSVTLRPRLVQAGTVVQALPGARPATAQPRAGPAAPPSGPTTGSGRGSGTSQAPSGTSGTSGPSPESSTTGSRASGTSTAPPATGAYRAAIEAYAGVGRLVTVPVRFAPPGSQDGGIGAGILASPSLPSARSLLSHFPSLSRPGLGPTEETKPGIRSSLALSGALAFLLAAAAATSLTWARTRRLAPAGSRPTRADPSPPRHKATRAHRTEAQDSDDKTVDQDN